MSLQQVIEIIRHPRDKAESKYNPDVGVSKEDEDRYQKLLVENDELQKLIAQVWYIIMFMKVLTREKTVQKYSGYNSSFDLFSIKIVKQKYLCIYLVLGVRYLHRIEINNYK